MFDSKVARHRAARVAAQAYGGVGPRRCLGGDIG